MKINLLLIFSFIFISCSKEPKLKNIKNKTEIWNLGTIVTIPHDGHKYVVYVGKSIIHSPSCFCQLGTNQ